MTFFLMLTTSSTMLLDIFVRLTCFQYHGCADCLWLESLWRGWIMITMKLKYKIILFCCTTNILRTLWVPRINLTTLSTKQVCVVITMTWLWPKMHDQEYGTPQGTSQWYYFCAQLHSHAHTYHHHHQAVLMWGTWLL